MERPVSGNPTGRPKGWPSIQELIEREARRLVKIRSGNDIVSLAKQEPLVRKLYAKALEGDLAAVRLIIQCATLSGAGFPSTRLEEPIDPSAVCDETLKRMLSRFEGIFRNDDPDEAPS